MKQFTKPANIRIALTLALSAVMALGAIFIPGTPAFAAGPNCVNHAQHQAGNPPWGTGHICISAVYAGPGGNYRNVSVTLMDTLTDGYCVHAEYHDNAGWWPLPAHDVANSPVTQSCGLSFTSDQIPLHSSLTEVRIIRGPVATPNANGTGTIGNWFTVWPD